MPKTAVVDDTEEAKFWVCFARWRFFRKASSFCQQSRSSIHNRCGWKDLS